ncbi:MAG: hypothetical protein QOH56_4332 [Pseudonocardiales bacterium]|jgi:transcriptional regulator with XRE-family HTH domain|nr:hypothetical protein [Pseudonocardiales bacterium]
MPRPNRLRSLQSEANLARRIAFEREQRAWTYEGTAKRMTDAGCAIQASAIYKIEKGEPPRRISVDELVAFSKVFELDIEDLLVPVEIKLSKAATELFERWTAAKAEVWVAADRAKQAESALRDHYIKHPVAEEGVRLAMRAWVDDAIGGLASPDVQDLMDENAAEHMTSTLLAQLRGGPEWDAAMARAQAEVDAEEAG